MSDVSALPSLPGQSGDPYPDSGGPAGRLRILYVNPHLSRADGEPGVTGRNLIRGLRDAGAEVIPFDRPFDPAAEPDVGDVTGSRPPGWSARLRRRLPPWAATAAVEYTLLARGVRRTLAGCGRAWRLRRRGERPDVVLARVNQADWTPWLVARLLGRPLVLEVHTPFYIERQLRRLTPAVRRHRVLRWFERVQWRRAARVWVNSRQLESILVENGVDAGRVRFISIGVSPNPHRQPPAVAEDGGEVRVIFVGSFYPWHGVDVLLEAFALARRRAPALRLTLVGDGLLRAASQRRAAALGIAGVVEFTGWMPHDRALARIAAAHVAVAPYLRLEPFYFDPLKVLEYMSAGLATIASDQGRVGEMLSDGRTGLLVPPGDAAALADALARLAADASLRGDLGRAALARIESDHALGQTPRRVLDLCREAAWATTVPAGSRGTPRRPRTSS